MQSFAKDALDAGACYVMAAGTAADDVEDAFDRMIVNGGYATGNDDVICTTNHKSDPLDEILCESIYVASGAAKFKAENPPILALFLATILDRKNSRD